MSDSTPSPAFVGFSRPEDLFAGLAGEIAARLAAGIMREGRASFVASGGTTPGDLYDVLALRDVQWENVTVTLSDERWVDPGSDRSNEKLLRTRLLTQNAAAARLVPLKTLAPDARAAEPEVNAAIAAIARPFDVVLLGMGEDGHTASLIPGADGLAQALDLGDPALVRAIHSPAMGERLTLTLRALLDARWIVILIRGDAKLAAYRQALAGDDVAAAPVRAVLHQSSVPVAVYWAE